jgi:outer membrane protein OmpA-like peptidoglycan-associated protein
MEAVIDTNNAIDYLLVIEGNTQRFNMNWINNPDGGYRLSYRRALALYNYWNENGINFRNLGLQCEVMIAGSGYFSQSRDEVREERNRRFTIQVTSKVGKYLNKNGI